MKIFFIFAISLCAYAAEVDEKKAEEPFEQNKDKRQTRDEFVPSQFIYRTARKQEQVTPVEEPQDDDNDRDELSRTDNEEYRPGQVFSLNAQELLDLQAERQAPLQSSAQLQQLYASPQPEHRQNLQQIYYVETATGRQQVALQPSHAVIARPHYSSNGGEASVGAALSVSDSGVSPSASYDPELLALLGQPPAPTQLRHDEQSYQRPAQVSTQSTAPQYQVSSVAPQYQQVERYTTKPSKKPVKNRPKVHSHIAPPQSSGAPQQYLIETTNIQSQPVLQYQAVPQPQRAPQALRYVPIPTGQAYIQQALYERPESQGLKVVTPPKLQQQPRSQLAYRVLTQYQQPEASPKQYRIVDASRPQPIRQEQRVPASSIERPVTYLKRFQEPEKMRSVKIYDPLPQDAHAQQVIGEQYYLRPVYRTSEARRYETAPLAHRQLEQPRAVEPSKPPHSAIYVNQKVAPKKVVRPQNMRIEQPAREASLRVDHATTLEQVNFEQQGQSLEEQRSQLPPPKNNRAYTPEEFAALVAAGYAVTPIPVAPLEPAQSRSSVEAAPPSPSAHPPRRLYSARRHHYLPLRGDDAP